MRLPLLLLLLFGISCAAPINQEAAARKFFENILEHYTKLNHRTVVDLVSQKVEKFFPGFISVEDHLSIREAFAEYRDKENLENPPSFTIDPKIVERVKAEVNKRIAKLDNDNQAFIKKAIDDFSVGGMLNVSHIATKFTSLRTKYDGLSSSAKSQIAGQFEVFNQLNEVQPFITVGDRLWGIVTTGCQDVPEFNVCKMLKKKNLISYEEASADHEGSAKTFFSKLINAIADQHISVEEKDGAAFDLLWDKVDKYLPGFFSDEYRKLVRTDFIRPDSWAQKLERSSAMQDPKAFEGAGTVLEKKILALNDDARKFLGQAFQDFKGTSDFPQAVTKFAELRTKYAAAKSSAKDSLAGQFVFFNQLDEIQALLTVGERLWGRFLILCAEMDEGGVCDW